MSALRSAMNPTASIRSLDSLRAVARARYHGYARAFVASQPPFVRLANSRQEAAARDQWHPRLSPPLAEPIPAR
jgi:hypothetical protein